MPFTATRRILLRLMTAVILILGAGVPTARAAFLTIDFDTTPTLALAPSTFTGARQDLSISGLATVLGGTPVGNPTFLASFTPGGGVRNAYGTRSGTSLGYLQNLSINFDPSQLVTRVQGTLFNGFTDLNSYTVAIFNGSTQVGSTTFTDLTDNTTTTGFGKWDLAASAITRLVIMPDLTFSGGAWDYFIDNVGVTFTPAAVPEPSSVLCLVLGLVGTSALARRSRRTGARV